MDGEPAIPPKLLSNGLQHLRSRETHASKNPRSFFKHFYCNKSLVSKLELTKELKKHTGCVNTVHWSACGRYLVSGSDDTRLCVWDYHKNGQLVTAWTTGHTANIFSARFLPLTNNSRVISCAGDGEIRAFQIDIGAKAFRNRTHVYTCHQGSVKRLVTWNDNPNNFMSCSEDGTVRLFDLRESDTKGGKICVDFQRTSMDINSIDLSGDYFCIGGGDPIVRVYDFRKLNFDSAKQNQPCAMYAPYHLVKNIPRGGFSYRGHITGVAFHDRDILATYSGDSVYLFRMGETKQYTPSLTENRQREDDDDEDDDSNSLFGHSGIPTGFLESDDDADSSVETGMIQDDTNVNYVDELTSDFTDDTSSDAKSEINQEDKDKKELKKEDSEQKQEEHEQKTEKETAAKLDLMEVDDSKAKEATQAEILPENKSVESSATPTDSSGPSTLVPSGSAPPSTLSPQIPTISSTSTGFSIEPATTESGVSIDDCTDENILSNSLEDKTQKKKEKNPKKRKIARESDDNDADGEDTKKSKKSKTETKLMETEIPEAPANPEDYYLQKYTGHCNIQTVKSVSFFGPNADYVVSGSDDGNIFIWEKTTAKLVNLMHGDRHVVNIMVGHPFDPILATSGIENHVKIFVPTKTEPSDLSNAQNVYARNRGRIDATADRPAIPMSLIRRLIQTGALQVVAPRRARHADDDGDDDDAGAGGGVGGFDDDDEGGVECNIS